MEVSLPVAGLDANLTREMLFSLRQSDDLKSVCQGTLALLQESINLVINSMTVIFEERQYWRHVLDADPFEKMQISFLHAGPMGFVSSMRKLIFSAQINNKESAIDLKLAILRETFNKLASILGKLYQSGCVLKKISCDIENMAFTVIDIVDENSSQDGGSVSSSTGISVATKDLAYSIFVQRSRRRIKWALRNMIRVYENLEDFSDVSYASDGAAAQEGSASTGRNLTEMLDFASKKFALLEDDWLAMITTNFVRQPTHFQKHWFRYLIFGLTFAMSSYRFFRFAASGDLMKFISHAKFVIAEQYQERLKLPITNLLHELFDKLNREQLVTAEEIQQSKQVLHNMLLEYVDNEENSINLLDREKSLKMLNRIIGSAEPPTAPDLRKIKGLEDEIMKKVIKNYEMESFSPMKGLLFGNLMTVMLIQMQKMKMHMEAALLTMDQVLTSNELTMAATAAVPGIALSGMFLYSLYWMFIKPRAPRNRSSEQLQLRLAFGDIERAINSLILQITDSTVKPSTFKVCLHGPTHLDSDDLSSLPCTPDKRLVGSIVDEQNTESGHVHANECDKSEDEVGECGVLTRNELLVLRYNGLLIFQTTKFAHLLKPLFLSPRHCVAPDRFSLRETICTCFGIQISAATWAKWFPFSLFSLFRSSHPVNCRKCSYSHSGIGASIVTEYDGIKRDILDLANPLLSPMKKLELTGKMRIAYHCLSV